MINFRPLLVFILFSSLIINLKAQCTILSYPFSGNANDTSVNLFHATVYGATLTSDRFGNPNNAYAFDGINDYLDAGNVIDLSQHNVITISAWMYPTTTNSNNIRQTGISIGSKSTGELMLRTGLPGNDKFQAALAEGTINSANGASNSVRSSDYSYNRWYHLVAVYQNNKVELWVNGVMQSDSARNLGGTTLNTVPSNASLWIGKSTNPNKTKFFAGKIDDVQIFNCAADAAMVDSLYSLPFVGLPELNNEPIKMVSIYPNPASELVHVELLGNNKIDQISLVNNTGQAIKELIYDGKLSETIIDVSNLSSGIYLLKVSSKGNTLIKRMIKD